MSTSCPICLDHLGGSDVVATPCGHVFHASCMTKWINDNKKACPECRSEINQKDLIKLFLHFARSDSVRGTESELESTVAELDAKKDELIEAAKKMRAAQKQATHTEKKHASMHEKYLAAQKELDSTKCGLLKLDVTIIKLDADKALLERDLLQYSEVQKIMRKGQQEPEEVLLAQEVGEEKAKTMTHLISLFKQELHVLTNQKQQLMREEAELLHRLEQRNADIEKLQKSKSDLKQELEEAYDSPVMRDVEKENVVQPVSCTPSQTPVRCDCQRKVLGKVENQCDVTPITVDFSAKKFPKMKVIIGKPDPNPQLKRSFPNPSLLSFKRKVTPEDAASITRVGYNGIGGHESVVMRPQVANPKPNKKNSVSKRRK